MEHDDDWFRMQGRLDAYENVLTFLISEVSRLSGRGDTYLEAFADRLRTQFEPQATVAMSVEDRARHTRDLRRAMLEIADAIEARMASPTQSGGCAD
jgi:hypothetical protein